MSRPNPLINTSVTFRHTESTEALKSYASEKVKSRFERFISGEANVHIILSVEKRDHTAEVIFHTRGHDHSCKATTSDLYSAIDKAVDMVSTQLRKEKERMQSHRHVQVTVADA
ncbi:ribosome-associated translation inhibitor RaiA [bacterium]|nr:ribosome-associated translation inhibitor RaiA [bacterium]